MSYRAVVSAGSLAVVVVVAGLSVPAIASPTESAPTVTTPVAATAPSTPAARTGDIIVKFTAGSAAASSNAARAKALDQTGAATDTDLDETHRLAGGATVIKGATPQEADAVAATLEERTDVAYAEPDVRLTAATAPNDPFAPNEWALQPASAYAGAADLENAWSRSTGAGVTVAVVDSGILAHPDLAGQVAKGYDFISDRDVAGDGGGRDADPSDPGDWTEDNECEPKWEAEPSSWHGTHVAGTVAAATSNGLGVAGAAPGARVLPVRVLGHCGGSVSDIADAIVWSAGGTISGVPANATPAKVINLSLGGSGACSKTLQTAINAARSRGAVVVAAAGNEKQAASKSMPGNCAGVVDVAAVTSTAKLAWFSDYGPPVTLAAPGVDIWSTYDKGVFEPAGYTYAALDGTSMAAPHVSAVAAMVLSAKPGLTPDAVKAVLVAGARPNSDARLGAGLLDASRTLTAAGVPDAPAPETPTPTPTPVVTPTPTTPVTPTPTPTPTVTPQTPSAPQTTSAAPKITAAPIAATVTTATSATAAWEPFNGSSGTVRYDVQTRIVTVDRRGKRVYSPWRTGATKLAATSMTVTAKPGTVVQYRVRGTDDNALTSAWSGSGVLAYPLDATPSVGAVTKGWTRASVRGALGGGVWQTARKNAAFTAKPVYANSVYVIATKGSDGGLAGVYIDGVRKATVSSSAKRLANGQVIAKVLVPFGRHTVKVVNASGTLRLDGLAFGR